MKYAEAVRMVKQASKWLPMVKQFGTKNQLGKAIQTRLWQKAVQQADGKAVTRLPASDAYMAARQAMQTAPKGTTMASLYKAFRQDPSTIGGARALYNTFKTTPAETVPSYVLRDAVNRRMQTFDNLTSDKNIKADNIIPDNKLLTLEQLKKYFDAEWSDTDYYIEQLKQKARGLHVNPNAKALTASDIQKEFNTNNLMFHGNGVGRNVTDWLSWADNRPVWMSPLAPVSAGYALPETPEAGPERPVLSVFAMPQGELGTYTRNHMTPHFADPTGARRDTSGRLRRWLLKHTGYYKGRGGWGAMPNYEFVLRPEVRDAWLSASTSVHEPKSYYVVGRLPRNVQDRTNIQSGLTDDALRDLRFYDMAEGMPPDMYNTIQQYIQQQIHEERNKFINNMIRYRPAGTIPKFVNPYRFVFR